MRRSIAGLAAALALALSSGIAPAVELDWTVVGDPGNACHVQGNGCFGAVDSVYRISRVEVTNAQYAEFLNHVAADDVNGLYNLNMGLPTAFGGIVRSGSPGTHQYAAISGRHDLPVNWVSMWDAMRFANWLHNGQPTGAQDDTTTEDGAYTITALGVADNSILRNPGARVFVASEDEWYKAAYYDPGSQTYFDFATSSDTHPTCALPGSTPNTANCTASSPGPVSPAGDLTPVGAYDASPSPFGTFDQEGNVAERTDSISSDPQIQRTYHGDSFALEFQLALPEDEVPWLGFRIASSDSNVVMTPRGADFQIHGPEAGDQLSPALEVFDDGGFVIAWADELCAPCDYDTAVHAQFFDASGNTMGSRILVHSPVEERHLPTDIVETSDGHIVIASFVGTSFGSGALGYRYDTAGTRLATYGLDPGLGHPFVNVAPTTTGGLARVGFEDDPFDLSIDMAFYDTMGDQIGDSFWANTYRNGSQTFPDIASDRNGTLVAVWTHLGAEFTGGSPGYYYEHCDIIGQAFGESGNFIGSPFQVNDDSAELNDWCPSFPSIAMRADGGFLVVWEGEGSTGSDQDGGSIQARLFDANRQPASPQFQVNMSTMGEQTFDLSHQPVAATADGGFLVAWTSDSTPGNDMDPTSVQARLVAHDGVPAGAEFQLNTTTSGSQFEVAIRSSADGNVVAVWTSEDQPTQTIRARRLSVPAPHAPASIAGALLTLLAVASRTLRPRTSAAIAAHDLALRSSPRSANGSVDVASA